jgi:hypothetical protein
MKQFTVIWHRDVQEALAELWLSAAEPAAVTSAGDLIDHMLASDPLAGAQEVSEGLFRLDVPPLRVYFEVSEADRVVRVARVRLLGQ